jgi:hypothetical protein
MKCPDWLRYPRLLVSRTGHAAPPLRSARGCLHVQHQRSMMILMRLRRRSGRHALQARTGGAVSKIVERACLHRTAASPGEGMPSSCVRSHPLSSVRKRNRTDSRTPQRVCRSGRGGRAGCEAARHARRHSVHQFMLNHNGRHANRDSHAMA